MSIFSMNANNRWCKSRLLFLNANASYKGANVTYLWCKCPLQGCECKVYSWRCKVTPWEDADANLLSSMQNAPCGYVMMWMPTCGYVMMQMLFIWQKCKLTKVFFLFFFIYFPNQGFFHTWNWNISKLNLFVFFQRSVLFNPMRLKYPVHHSCLQTCFILT